MKFNMTIMFIKFELHSYDLMTTWSTPHPE